MSDMRESGRTIPVPAGGWASGPVMLSELTTEDLAALLEGSPAVALIPIGSTEPHGPHLPLATDALLSEEACRRAARTLRDRGIAAVVAPPVAYGVTQYAKGFRGAIGLRPETLLALLHDVASSLLDDGFAQVSFVNNHLEPEHVAIIERAVESVSGERGPTCVSFPNHLGKRWGKTLTDEFKRGNCHAGRYEGSLVLATRQELFRADVARDLPPLDVSLSDEIKKGGSVTFHGIGMARAYTGAPAEATREEGDKTYARLVEMIVTEVTEKLAEEGENTSRGQIPT
jgi:creatinine amidohydrolase